jgi:hypothetical protein
MEITRLTIAGRLPNGRVYPHYYEDPQVIPVLYINYLDNWDHYRCVYHQDVDMVEYQFDEQSFDDYDGGELRHAFTMTEVIFATGGPLYHIPVGLAKHRNMEPHDDPELFIKFMERAMARNISREIDHEILTDISAAMGAPAPTRCPLAKPKKLMASYEYNSTVTAAPGNMLHAAITIKPAPLMVSMIERFRPSLDGEDVRDVSEPTASKTLDVESGPP